jgi:hypothetical protein
MSFSLRLIGSLLTLSLVCGGCTNQTAREALTLQPQALELRRIQSRRFETTNEHALLTASLEVLQDLGFSLDETEPDLGLIVASKNRDASSTGEMVGTFLLNTVGDSEATYEVEQKIRASVVTQPVGGAGTRVRVTFQRIVWNNQGAVAKNESIEEPKVYRDFFVKLSNSVFLTAHET